MNDKIREIICSICSNQLDNECDIENCKYNKEKQ